MLSRTAENLYWISRYMERAETMARLLDVGYRMSLFPNPKGYHNEWDSVLSAAGASQGYFSKYTELNQDNTAVYRKQETMLYWLEQLLPQRRGLP